MFGIGMQELMIILLVALVVIGPKKLPEVAKTIAKGVRELRRASDDLRSTIMVDIDEPYRPPRYQPPRELPPRAGDDAKKASAEGGEGASSSDDGDSGVPPGITGSVVAAAGTVSREDVLADDEDDAAGDDGAGDDGAGDDAASAEAAPTADPDDAEDHSGMPYAPGSPELDELLAKARARQERDRATRSAGDDPA